MVRLLLTELRDLICGLAVEPVVHRAAGELESFGKFTALLLLFFIARIPSPSLHSIYLTTVDDLVDALCCTQTSAWLGITSHLSTVDAVCQLSERFIPSPITATTTKTCLSSAMFKKPPTLQSRTLLKSSASRTIKEQIAAAFPLLTPDDLLLLFPPKTSLTCDKLSAPSHVSLFSVTPTRPLFFSYTPTAAAPSSSSPSTTSTHFCPTVYALWLCPHLLPPLFIHPAVTPALIRGADLMLPGILRPPNHSYNLQRGQLRCVVARGNPSPMAVGELAVGEGEAVAAGWVGKGLRVLQCYGDGLWSGGERVVPNEGFVDGKVEAVIGSEEARAMLDAAIEDGRAKGQSVDELVQLRQQVESKLKLTDDLSQRSSGEQKADTLSTAVPSADTQSTTRGAGMAAGRDEDSHGTLDAAAEQKGREADERKEADVDEDDNGSSSAASSREPAVPVDVMDVSLFDSLLLAIKTDLPDDAFPLTPSVLLSRYMEACNPHPHRLDLKHSSYKKMAKFLKAMQKHSLLFIKDKQGELTVTAVHRQHPDVLAAVGRRSAV